MAVTPLQEGNGSVFVCVLRNKLGGEGRRVGSGTEELEPRGLLQAGAGLAHSPEWPGKEWDSDEELHPRRSFGSRGGGGGAELHVR